MHDDDPATLRGDNATLRYYEAEMRYLREAGEEFAEAFPDRARYLHLDKPGARDPYVDRLFEGFAFLVGRLRQKLDDDLPEMTEGLVSLLWPQYLRTIPSLSVIELKPDHQALKKALVIGKGFAVRSQPVGPKATRCEYATTRDLTLRPLALTGLRVGSEDNGQSCLRLRFECGADADWSRISLADLPFYLDADAPLASALHRALTQVQTVYWRGPDQEQRAPIAATWQAGGFGADDGLWPSGQGAFAGYQLLLEYFTFREKFMFVNLCGLQQLPLAPGQGWFELDLVLSEPWPREWSLTAQHLRLHAVPVINLFPLEADPIMLEPQLHDFLLRPVRLQDGHTEIFSVDAVSTSKSSDRHEYQPFSAFRHKAAGAAEGAAERYFHTRLRRGVNGLHDTWLLLGGDGFDRDSLEPGHSLYFRMTGTNGLLPRKALVTTLLDAPMLTPVAGLRVRNLCAPTLPCYPPDRDRFHWRVLSHLGSTYLSLMDNADVLRGTLALYDWSGCESNRRRLAAIAQVRHSLIERFERNYLRRGVDIEITLDSNGFQGEGDICLFGEMLSRFFALYADIHLFTQLTLVLQPSGKCLRWNEKHSQRIPG